MSHGWEWPVSSPALRQGARVACIREVPYRATESIETNVLEFPALDGGHGKREKALSLNISLGGMLLLMDRRPEVSQMFRVYVPGAAGRARIPTLARVRWVREAPFVSKCPRTMGKCPR